LVSRNSSSSNDVDNNFTSAKKTTVPGDVPWDRVTAHKKAIATIRQGRGNWTREKVNQLLDSILQFDHVDHEQFGPPQECNDMVNAICSLYISERAAFLSHIVEKVFKSKERLDQ
jgi:hypothetical protein